MADPTRLLARCAMVQVCGLVVAAAAGGTRWALSPVRYYPVPPGLVLLGVAVVLVVALRRPWTVALGVASAGVVLLQLLGSGVFARSTSTAVTVALGLELVGVVIALVAGTAALLAGWAARRPAGTRLDWRRAAQVTGLLVLAPVCAEYLSAYDDSTGHALQLVGNLVVFVPLYGCPALLIREVARRGRLGWVGIVLLATAFGLMQAGVVDQSLFSTDYRQIEGWDASYRATLIAPLGVSAANFLNFVGGHVVFSICAPIALVEGARPLQAGVPWLGRTGLVVTAVLYAAASALVLSEHLKTEASHASVLQVTVSLALVAGLIAAGVRLGDRPRPALDRQAPGVRTVFAAALAVALVHGLATETWSGVAMIVASFAAAGIGLAYGSRLTGWRVGHVVAVATAPLLVRAVLAFTYDPLVGEVSEPAKYAHNVVMLLIVLTAVGLTRPRWHSDVAGGRGSRGQAVTNRTS